MTDKPQSAPVAPEKQPAPPRRPYTPPVVESGEAFERVQLQSGVGLGDPLDCPPQ